MATLKIHTIYDNTIWLTDVTIVETLAHAYRIEGKTAWESLQVALEDLPSENLREQIRHEMTLFANHDNAVNGGALSPSHTVFVKVQFANGEPQFWLLPCRANYLMVDGKTIDRI